MKQLILAILLGIAAIGICYAHGGNKSENIVCMDSTDTEITTAEIEEILSSMIGSGIFETSPPKMMFSDKPFNYVSYEDPPEPINPIVPEYPEFAKRVGIEGIVVLQVYVYADGTIGQIEVLRSLMKGPGGLDEAAINAVKQWKFQPGKAGGKAVDTQVLIPIEFTLPKQEQDNTVPTALQQEIRNALAKMKEDIGGCGYFEDPPTPINPIAPEYPAELKKTGIEGIVLLEVEVFKDGSVGVIKVVKTLLKDPCKFAEAAVCAVKQWKFKPGKSGGKPIDTTVTIPIEFSLTH
jgi:protein TonB